MGANTSEILAKLGIDTGDVPKDLAEAEAFFKKFGKNLESGGESQGGNFSKGFAKGFGKALQSSNIGGLLASAIGLNIGDIANKLAETLVGATKEQLKEIGDIADARRKLVEEAVKDGQTVGQQIDSLDKDITRAEARLAKLNETKTGTETYRDPLSGATRTFQKGPGEKTQEEENKIAQTLLEIDKLRVERNKLLKDEKKEIVEIDKADRDLEMMGLDNQEKLNLMQEELMDLVTQNSNIGMKGKESQELTLKILQKRKEIEEQVNKIQEEQNKNWETQKDYNDYLLKTTEKRKDTLEDIAALEKKIASAKTKLTDPSKLTLGELANINPLQFGVGQGTANASNQAREISDLERQAEKARLSGDVSSAEELLNKANDARNQLGQSGLLKSDQFNKNQDVVDSIETMSKELQKKFDSLGTILNGKFVNE